MLKQRKRKKIKMLKEIFSKPSFRPIIEKRKRQNEPVILFTMRPTSKRLLKIKEITGKQQGPMDIMRILKKTIS